MNRIKRYACVLLTALIVALVTFPIDAQVSSVTLTNEECGSCEQPDATSAAFQRDSSIDIKRATFTPRVIPVGYTDSVRLELHISGAPTRVLFQYIVGGTEVDLFDDGQNGDLQADDNIYTLLIPADSINALPLLPCNSILSRQNLECLRPWVGFVYLYDVTRINARYNIVAERMHPEIADVPIRHIADGIQVTPNLVNILGSVGFDGFDARPWASLFYDHFSDDFDFLNFLLIEGRRSNRYHASVKNSVRGIGASRFDNSNEFGSKGRLQGYNVFPIPALFDGASTAYSHEIGHQWINFLDNTRVASSIPHWPLSHLGKSVMGVSPNGGQGLNFNFDLVREGSGVRVRSRNVSAIFNNLDLYLMGMLPPDSTAPFLIFKDQSKYPQKDSFHDSSAFDIGTIDEIVSVAGPRIPDHQNARRNFRLATIAISENMLQPHELAFYDFMSRRATMETVIVANPFYIATGGRGRLITEIDAGLFTDIKSQELKANKPRLSLRSFPNPFKSNVTLVISSKDPVHASLEIIDIAGKHVASLADQQIAAGTSTFKWTPDGLPTGIYFARVTTGSWSATHKIMLGN